MDSCDIALDVGGLALTSVVFCCDVNHLAWIIMILVGMFEMWRGFRLFLAGILVVWTGLS